MTPWPTSRLCVDKRKFDNQCQSMKPLMELLILLKQWIPLILLKQHQHLSTSKLTTYICHPCTLVFIVAVHYSETNIFLRENLSSSASHKE
ncbi:hypothetical protein FRX31_013430 [Thalictrum thalictroides]|uniref:Uncharacterized protein n=1 Tax=Thalictrum thalictroides TaxID=46969 RepID=A0A7J6UUG5_THATH|nr:hypothetical protein FRX31_034321 [Thalictrum thalictroides]KAF5196983.1 hypothetical protein FRX31_013430 [Thalictrum thalictroides]